MANTSRAVETPRRGIMLPERLRSVGQTYGALIALLILVVYNIIFTPYFLDPLTLNTNLTQVAPVVVVGTGMTLVIATGGIDLSVGALMAIAGALAPIIFLGKLVPIDICRAAGALQISGTMAPTSPAL